MSNITENNNNDKTTRSHRKSYTKRQCNFMSCNKCNPDFGKLSKEDLFSIRESRKKVKFSPPSKKKKKYCNIDCEYCLHKLEAIRLNEYNELIQANAYTNDLSMESLPSQSEKLETTSADQRYTSPAQEANYKNPSQTPQTSTSTPNQTPLKQEHPQSPEKSQTQPTINDFRRETAIGDGNCLFRSIALCLGLPQEQHSKVRRRLIRVLKENPKVLQQGLQGTKTSAEEYLQEMSKSGTYGSYLEISALHFLTGLGVYVVYKENNDYKSMEAIQSSNGEFIYILRSGEDPFAHYDALVPHIKLFKPTRSQQIFQQALSDTTLKDKLKVILWNCRSIACNSKKLYLRQIASKENAAVILLQETFLKPEDDFFIPGYKIFRADNQLIRRKGVAILVDTNLDVSKRITLQDSDGRFIKLVLSNGIRKLSISSLYLEPTGDYDNLTIPSETIHSDVVGGDLNEAQTGLEREGVYHTSGIEIIEQFDNGFSDHPILIGMLDSEFKFKQSTRVTIIDKYTSIKNNEALLRVIQEKGFLGLNSAQKTITISNKSPSTTLDNITDWESIIEGNKNLNKILKAERNQTINKLASISTLTKENWELLNSYIQNNRKQKFYFPDDKFQDILKGFSSVYEAVTDLTSTEPAWTFNKISSILSKLFAPDSLYVPKSKALDSFGFSQKELIKMINTELKPIPNFKALLESVVQQHRSFKLLFHNESRVIFLNKKDNPETWKDYRPITILPAWLIVLEKLAYPSLRSPMESAISTYQFGFKTGSSCNLAKLYVSYQVQMNGLNHMLFIDVRKAYDSVDRNLLREKVNKLLDEPTSQIVSLFLDIYDSLNLNIYGSRIHPRRGLAQGSTLSPTLFNIYINEVVNELNKLDDSKIIAYADDLLIISKSNEKLQKIATKAEKALQLLKLSINASKTAYVSTDIRCKISLGGQEIYSQASYKYLGQEMNSLGHDPLNFQTRLLIPIQNKLIQNYSMSTLGKIKIFQTYLRSKFNHLLPMFSVNKKSEHIWTAIRKVIFKSILGCRTTPLENMNLFRLDFWNIIMKPLLQIINNFNTAKDKEFKAFITRGAMLAATTWLSKEQNLDKVIVDTIRAFIETSKPFSVEYMETKLNDFNLKRLYNNQNLVIEEVPLLKIKFPELIYLFSNAPAHMIEELLQRRSTLSATKRLTDEKKISHLLKTYLRLIHLSSLQVRNIRKHKGLFEAIEYYTLLQIDVSRELEDCNDTISAQSNNLLNQIIAKTEGQNNETIKQEFNSIFSTLHNKFREKIVDNSRNLNRKLEIATSSYQNDSTKRKPGRPRKN